MAWWTVPVKEHVDGVSMRCGTLVVEADSVEVVPAAVAKITSTWEGGQYVPPFAQAKGPFATREEAEVSG